MSMKLNGFFCKSNNQRVEIVLCNIESVREKSGIPSSCLPNILFGKGNGKLPVNVLENIQE